MSLHRRIEYSEVKEWSKNPGTLREKIKDNDLLFVTPDKFDEVKRWLKGEQVHHLTLMSKNLNLHLS